MAFGVLTAADWELEGTYAWFGVLVEAEVIAAGAGCLPRARRGTSWWMAWWVALVVVTHFLPLPLALLPNDWSRSMWWYDACTAPSHRAAGRPGRPNWAAMPVRT
ncbi:hypothetical protein [Nonomuraea solani]|uniref:hypothetical protein n=1 Tax=Nonomuraea solani TaxID=1144553 RepID=UPI000CDEBCE4|nr:hypothetical protein [Nonomuraea solani]